MASDLCLTTFVFGAKYQEYIPLLVYTLAKAYPDFHTCIFVHETLTPQVRKKIDLVQESYSNITVKEQYMASVSLKGQRGKAIRWVLWDECFREYKAVYYIDIDMLYAPETPSLFEQHMTHCQVLGSCYSNVVRRPRWVRNWHWRELARTLKHNSFSAVLRKIRKGPALEYRCSGLHFVKVEEYFPRLLSYRDRFLEILLSKRTFPEHVAGFRNESFLWYMLKTMGVLVENHQSDDTETELMDPRRYGERVFRPHHGIHLGCFRREHPDQPFLKSDYYRGYYDYLKTVVFLDPLYQELARSFSPFIAESMRRMREYYEHLSC